MFYIKEVFEKVNALPVFPREALFFVSVKPTPQPQQRRGRFFFKKTPRQKTTVRPPAKQLSGDVGRLMRQFFWVVQKRILAKTPFFCHLFL